MSCEHPTITAGVIHHGKRAAIGDYCPECNSITWRAKDRDPLTQNRGQHEDAREKAVRDWLGE